VAVPPEPKPEPVAVEPEPVGMEAAPVLADPAPSAPEPSPHAVVDVDRLQRVFEGTLDALGQAHHRPFSRG
jgi:hypothetical protein